MMNRNKVTINNRYPFLRQCLAVLLSFVLLIGSFTFLTPVLSAPSANAANTDTKKALEEILDEKDLIITVDTGSVSGDRIDFFQIYYTDVKGTNRTQTVFFHKAHCDLLDLAEKIGTVFGSNQGEYTQEKFLDEIFGYTLNDPELVLQPLSSQQFYVRTIYEAKTINKVAFYGEYQTDTTTAKNEWGCQNFDVVKPTEYFNAKIVGSIGNDYTVCFSGEKMYKSSKSFNLVFSKSGLIYPNVSNSGYTATNEIGEDEKAYKIEDNNLYVEMDIADVYEAGLDYLSVNTTKITEGYLKHTNEVFRLHETLLLQIDYYDAAQNTHSVSVPVVSSYFYALMHASFTKNNDPYQITETAGFFRQGDTIAFSVFLPGFASVRRFAVQHTNDISNFDFVFTPQSNIYREFLYSKLSTIDDTAGFSAIRLYSGSVNTLTYESEDLRYTPVYSEEPTPLYLSVSSEENGMKFKMGDKISNISAYKYDGDNTPLYYTYSSDTYLFAFSCKDALGGVTGRSVEERPAGELYLSVSYKRNNGEQVVSSEYKVSDLCKNYYGAVGKNASGTYTLTDGSEKSINLANTQADGEYMYYYIMAYGGTLYVPVKLGAVASFDSVTMRYAGSDEWQMSSLEIYRLRSLGKIKAEWKTTTAKVNTVPGCALDLYTDAAVKDKTDGKYGDYIKSFNPTVVGTTVTTVVYKDIPYITSRDYTGVKVSGYSKAVLLQDEQAKTISFTQGDVTDKKVDWTTYQYYMTYEDTKQNLGFADVEITYNVSVHVTDKVDNGEENEDCGSKNQFYFQLVFASGKSGYVLANQQLSSDGFRSGEIESFKIKVNRNYGNVRAIHIIPKDPNNDEALYDKLRIDYIDVSRVDESGVSNTWTIEIDDWIEINYSDNAAKDTIMGQSGLSESEMVRTYNVTETGYSANLLFEVTTGAYNGDEILEGSVTAVVSYTDADGVSKTQTVDVVDAMYEYANRDAKKTVSVYGITRPVSNTVFMFRAYHTDRFYLQLKNVSKVESVEFTVTGESTFRWIISNINVYLVNSTGQLIRNDNNEYEAYCDKQLLCSSKATQSNDCYVDIDGAPGVPHTSKAPIVYMSENKIKITSGSSIAEVTTVPESKDDTMNVYVYMSNDADPISDYNMKCNVSYFANYAEVNATQVIGNTLTTGIDLKKSSNGKMFYAMGVSASGLYNVASVALKSQSISTVRSLVNRVVIEHVRSGVIIGTYEIPFYDRSAEYTQQQSPSSSTAQAQKQVLEFQITDDSEEVFLSTGINDIAVSVTYTTLDGETAHTLQSPNVFLSKQDTSVLSPGGVYQITFNQAEVKNITAVNFIAQGDVAGKVGIKNAYILNYNVSSGNKTTTLIQHFSFGNSIPKLSASQRSMLLTSDGSLSAITVTPVTLTIKTAAADADRDSGTDCPVTLKLSYYDKNNNVRSSVYTDIASYAVSGTTHANDSLTVKLLVNNLSSVRSAALEPKLAKTGQNATWKIEKVDLSYMPDITEVPLSRAVNKTAKEGQAVNVNLANVTMSVVAVTENEKTGATVNQTYYSNKTSDIALQAPLAQDYIFYPEVDGSSEGLTCTVYRLDADGVKIDITDDVTVKGDGNQISSVVFKTKNADDEGEYLFVFKSIEFETVLVSVRLIVGNDNTETTTVAHYVIETTTLEAEETTSSVAQETTTLTSQDTTAKASDETTSQEPTVG